jgi:hypothetical protein
MKDFPRPAQSLLTLKRDNGSYSSDDDYELEDDNLTTFNIKGAHLKVQVYGNISTLRYE